MTSVADRERGRMVAAGVDGSPESVAAARYAVRAAGLRDLDLLLVHAYELPLINVPIEQAILDACRDAAHRLVADVASQLTVPSTMRIESVIQPELPSVLLERISRTVPLLVVGQDHLTWGERMLFGQVASHAAHRAACPVVIVPGGWRARRTGEQHPVVVALDGNTKAQVALRTAFEEAQLLRTRVLALHASPYGSPASEIAAQTANLTELLAGWKQDFPDISVRSLVVSGDPDASLLRWSRSAALLVMERPHRRMWGSWERSVARAVLKQTHCPMIVVPRQPGRGRNG